MAKRQRVYKPISDVSVEELERRRRNSRESAKRRRLNPALKAAELQRRREVDRASRPRIVLEVKARLREMVHFKWGLDRAERYRNRRAVIADQVHQTEGAFALHDRWLDGLDYLDDDLVDTRAY